MKFLLLPLFLFLPLFGAPQNEISLIEELIESTQKNLEAQKKLLQIAREFNASREAFLKDPDSGKLATALVKRAMRLHQHLEQEHLKHLFTTNFLQEIAFYNQVGKQNLSP